MNEKGDYTYVEVEANDNTPMSAQQVYRNRGEPFRVSAVRLYEGEPGGALYAVTGWSEAGAIEPQGVFAVQVEDSSAGSAYVVYGGEWGIRLRPASSDAPWSLDDPDQVGETHLVLADLEDLIVEAAEPGPSP